MSKGINNEEPVIKNSDVWLPACQNLIVMKRLVFCPIPKIACSNWKITLRRAAGYDDYTDDILAHDRDKNGLIYLAEKGRIARFFYLNSPLHIRGVFVRNPWTRVLSAYRSKIERAIEDGRAPKEGKKRFINETIRNGKRYCEEQNLVENENSEDLTFGEFLSYVESLRPELMNEHWQPQWYVAGLGRLHYDFVGRFERLESDAQNLCRLARLPELYLGEVKSVPKTASSTRDVFAEYYTKRRIEQVRQIYRRDISLLGYEVP